MKLPEAQKSNLHLRNKHRCRYDYAVLSDACTPLKSFLFVNQFGDVAIDFANPEAVKMLNKALLKVFYSISQWDIPAGYLCPPIPGRADYIHYTADLLASENQNIIPQGETVKVLDIGTGANCIYPLIGYREYGWSFVGSDVDDLALKSAQKIIDSNSLSDFISLRKQNPQFIFKNLIDTNEYFNLTVCNPPFHASYAAAKNANMRKRINLKQELCKPALNFGGQNNELWCTGGEVQFLNQMITESATVSQNCNWFTSLVSKKETLPACYNALDKVKAKTVKIIPMSQGQKVSRILAWTFN